MIPNINMFHPSVIVTIVSEAMADLLSLNRVVGVWMELKMSVTIFPTFSFLRHCLPTFLWTSFLYIGFTHI